MCYFLNVKTFLYSGENTCIYKQHSLSLDNQHRKRPWMSNSAMILRQKGPKNVQNKSDKTDHDWHLVVHWWVYIWAADKNIIEKQQDVERNIKTLCIVLITTNCLSNTEPREKWINSSIIQATASLVFSRIHQQYLYCSWSSWSTGLPLVLVLARNIMSYNLN